MLVSRLHFYSLRMVNPWNCASQSTVYATSFGACNLSTFYNDNFIIEFYCCNIHISACDYNCHVLTIRLVAIVFILLCGIYMFCLFMRCKCFK